MLSSASSVSAVFFSVFFVAFLAFFASFANVSSSSSSTVWLSFVVVFTSLFCEGVLSIFLACATGAFVPSSAFFASFFFGCFADISVVSTQGSSSSVVGFFLPVCAASFSEVFFFGFFAGASSGSASSCLSVFFGLAFLTGAVSSWGASSHVLFLASFPVSSFFAGRFSVFFASAVGVSPAGSSPSACCFVLPVLSFFAVFLDAFFVDTASSARSSSSCASADWKKVLPPCRFTNSALTGSGGLT